MNNATNRANLIKGVGESDASGIAGKANQMAAAGEGIVTMIGSAVGAATGVPGGAQLGGQLAGNLGGGQTQISPQPLLGQVQSQPVGGIISYGEYDPSLPWLSNNQATTANQLSQSSYGAMPGFNASQPIMAGY
jgi:hypothetical protein